jgi:hypothetical protein
VYCHDGVNDYDEVGVDCGGSCPACPGMACGSDGDCKVGSVCVHGQCAPPNCVNRELYFTDFSSDPTAATPPWTVVSGTWSWDGSSVFSNTDFVAGAEAWIGNSGFGLYWTDYVMQVRMRMDQSSNNAGFLFRTQTVSATNDQGDYYYVGLYADSGGGVVLGHTDASGYSQLSAAAYPISEGRFYTVQVVAQMDHLVIGVDGTALIDLNDPSLVYGSVGLRNFYSPSSYDSVLVCGAPAPCSSSSDCSGPDFCQAGFCRPPFCQDSTQDADETGVDCGGGSCAPCSVGQGCNTGADCDTGVCQAGQCRPASCGNGQVDGTETGVDCGGSDCAPCPNCTSDADCGSTGYCPGAGV